MSFFIYLDGLIILLLGIYGYLFASGIIYKKKKDPLNKESFRYKYRLLLKVFSVLIILIGIINISSSMMKQKNQEAIRPQLIKFAEVNNKTLPTMIDKETEFTKIEVNGINLIYSYRLVNTKKDDIDADFFKTGISVTLKKTFCNSKLAYLFSNGGSLKAVYFSKDNEFITSVFVDSDFCR